MHPTPSLRRAVRRFGAASAALLLSLLSCGREVTGPSDGVRVATGLSFVADFPRAIASLQNGASDVVPFNRVRVLFRRSDNSVALDQTFPFGANTDTLPLALNITLSQDAPSEGEPLSLFLRYINATGDTVFSGGPVQVLAVARRRGDPLPPPAQVPLEYSGPGASGTTVELSPDTVSIVAGDGFALSAVVRDGQGAPVSGAPVIFTSLDAGKLTLLGPSAPEGTALATRGTARVQAVLVANGAADTAFVLIAPKPASLQRLGLTALAGFTNSVLADSVVLRLLATDGGPIENAIVTVTIEGGGGVNDTTLVTDAAGRAAVQWTLGDSVGVAAQKLRFNSTGVAELVVAATATQPQLVATQVVITQEPATPVVSLQPMTPTLTIEARDSTNTLVPSHTGSVSVSVASGPGFVGEVTSTSFVNGVATFPNLGADLAGTYRLAVSSGTLTPDTTSAFTVVAGAPELIELVSGDAQTALVGEQLAAPISVRVTDGGTNPVKDVNVVFVVTAGGGTLQGASVLTDSLGIATLGSWTLGTTAGTQTINATFSDLAPVTITATAEPLAPVIELKVVGSNVVGFQRAGELFVRLLQPAPAGGLTVTLTSDSAQYLILDEPGTVAIAAGDTAATIGVFGSTIGTAVVRADAPGYTPDTLVVPVSLNLISLPTTLNVALDGTVSLPVQLSAPAPAGGVVVKLVSSATGTVGLVTDSVVIAAGTESANATVQGITLGSATITASNPNYAPDVSTVSVTAGVDIFNASLALNGSFGTSMTVRLVSGALPVAAPVGGIVVTLEAVNSACVNVQSTAVIDAGFTSVVVPVTAAAGGTFPCTSLVRASGPLGFATDSTTATVAAVPAIVAPNNQFLGSGLQRAATFSLGATNHGGTTVRIESTDPTRLLIAPNITTVGSAFVDVPINIGGNTGTFTLQSLEDVASDTVFVRLTAPGFVSDSFPTFRYSAAFEIVNTLASRTTASVDDPFTIRVGSTGLPNATTLGAIDAIRFGGVPVVLTLVNDSAAVVDLVTSAVVGDSVTVTIPVGASSSATSVAAGGVALRSQGAGVASIRASHPSLRALPTAVRPVTVTQASITSIEALSGTASIGRGLQRQVTITLSDPAPAGGVPITVKPSQPGFVLLAPSATVVGAADSVVLTAPLGVATVQLTLQVLESAPLDTMSLLVSAPGFGTRVGLVQVVEPVLQIANDLAATGTTNTIDDPFRAQVGSPAGPAGTTILNADAVRRGSGGMAISVVTDSAGVGTLVTSALTADSVTVLIAEGVGLSNSLVSAGGVAFRFLGEGVTTVRVQSALTRELTGATRQVTVTQPAISGLTGLNLAAGLQRGGSITLNAPAPAGGLPVTLTTDVAGRFLLAPNATTLGTDTLVVTVAAGTSSATFVAQALEVGMDTVVLTATAPGYTSRTSNLALWTPAVTLSALATSFTTLTADDPFVVQVGTSVTPTGNSVALGDSRRFGAPPLTVTLVSSNGEVGRLVTTALVSDTVTMQIAAGTSLSPSTVIAGGVAFRPLTSGTASISASIPGFTQSTSAAGSTVTVAAPAINFAAVPAIGAGLQASASGTLTASLHGGINIIIKSSNPAIAKVARLATDIAADSVIIPVANGVASFSYIVAGQDGALGQVSITARAQGFTDGSTVANVVTPGIDLGSLLTSGTAGGADDPFLVRVGTPNVALTSLQFLQDVRTGSSGITVTITSSNPTAGLLLTSTDTAGTVTLTIPAGSSTTPTNVALGGVALRPAAAGVTVVQPAAPGFTRMVTTGTVTVTVNP